MQVIERKEVLSVANKAVARNKEISIGKKGKLPAKTTMNLAAEKRQGINWAAAVPAILVICAAAAVISKVAVVDKLNELAEIRAENSLIQQRINDYNAQIDSYADVQEEYYHYTYTGLNSEELNRTDRVEILTLMDTYILPNANVDTWSVRGNILAVTLSDISLAQANQIVADIECDPLVDFCILTTASTDNSYNDEIIKANITAYLNGPVDLEGSDAS